MITAYRIVKLGGKLSYSKTTLLVSKIKAGGGLIKKNLHTGKAIARVNNQSYIVLQEDWPKCE
jgi:hypothetical protein